MATKGCGTPLRGSGKDQTIWKLEWTYSGATGEVTLDSAQSDEDPSIASPVADGASTGLTNITFPKSSRAWVQHCSIEAPTAGTAEQVARVGAMNATAGTCKFVVLSDALALEEGTENARGRLTLLLERP
jgi:hypothetical protein